MTILDIVYGLPDLLVYFVPGSIFIYLYNLFVLNSSTKSDSALRGVVASYVVKSITDAVLVYFNIRISILPSYMMCLIYCLSACIMAVVAYRTVNSNIFRNAMGLITHTSPTSNVWMNTIDFKDSALVILHLKDNRHFLGQVNYVDNDWLVLKHYAEVDVDEDGQIHYTEYQFDNRTLSLPVEKIDTFEAIYLEGSEMLERLEPIEEEQ